MRRLASGFLVAVAALAGCDTIDTNRTVEPYSSFGAAVYREGCQRVAYTGQLEQKANKQRTTVDVSGQYGRAVCVDGMAPPADAPPVLTAIVGQKSPLIAVVDTILPDNFLSTLEHFLEQILPLSDDGTMEAAIHSLGSVLGVMGDDPDFGPALARMAVRNGYRPTRTAAGLMRTIVNYPNLDDFIGKTLAMIAPGGTAETEWKQLLTAGSMALSTIVPVQDVADPDRTLRLTLDLLTSRHVDLASGTARPLVARDFRGLAAAAVDSKGAVLPPFVDKDKDGLADVDANGHFIDANGAVLPAPTPFPELGANDTAPRDALGRALVDAKSTTTLYKYLDLDGTVFNGLAHETLNLMDPTKDIAFGLAYGAGALMGPRDSKTQQYMSPTGGKMMSLTYNGFDTNQAAMLDLVHAFFQVMGDPGADQTFQVVYNLMNQYESPTARLVGAMLAANDLGKQYPNAQIPADSVLFDDLMVIVNRILAIDGLPQALLDALENPATKDFAPALAQQMMARNPVAIDVDHGPDYALTGNYDYYGHLDPVDRKLGDVDTTQLLNRSIMQRIAHLIHDSNGWQFCNKAGAKPVALGITFPIGNPDGYSKCGLFNIPDLGLFYALSMTSDKAKNANPSAKSGADFCAHVTSGDALAAACPAPLIGIGSQVPITGFGQFPTPSSLNRSLFLPVAKKPAFLQATTDDTTCSEGDKFIDVHNASLMAWEVPITAPPSGISGANFYTAVQPIMDAFASYDECTDPNDKNSCHNAAKIFVDLLAMLHSHWASPNSSYFGQKVQSTNPKGKGYAHTDNLVSYEPLLATILGQGDLVPAVLAIEPTLKLMQVQGAAGPLSARDALRTSANYLFRFGSAPGLTYRDGSTKVLASDGVTPVKQLTPYYLLADAYTHKRNALAAAPADQSAAWKRATSALVDQLLTVQKNPNGTYQFANRRFRAISMIVVNFLRGRMTAHHQAGDYDTWVHHTLTDDLTDKLSGPTFAALADFTKKIEGDDDARNQLYKLFQYLVNEADNDAVFQTALTTLADQVQMFLDDPDLVPVARVLGKALDPTSGAVDAQLTLTKKAHDLDSAKALLTILKNLYQQDAVTSVYPASTLADVLSELNRSQPGHGGDLSGVDYQTILKTTQNFLLDEQRGFLRFVGIVKARGPH